jgi:ZIP family zinc transporter
MHFPPLQTLLYACIPALVMAAAGAFATLRTPGPWLRAAILHFAAGVVFAVITVEIVPGVMRAHRAGETIIGFALGVAVMLGIRALSRKDKEGEGATEVIREPAPGRLPAGLLAGVAVDIAVDGLMLGIGFAAGAKAGRLLALALTIELISLGLATSASLGKAGIPRARRIALTSGVALLFTLGAVVGLTFLDHLAPHVLAGVLSFGAAALLFLVTEELLVEAHEEPETPLLTATFFVGFLLILILGMYA